MEAPAAFAADAPARGDLRPAAPVVVSVCTTCRAENAGDEGRPGPALLHAVRAAIGAQPGVLIRAVECLGVCKRPVTVAVSGADGFTFVFGDLDPASGPEAIASFVRDYAETDQGFVPWRQRPEVLRRSLVARIPPPAWSPSSGKPPG